MTRSDGFTLLEMVVAIGIFSVIATISSLSLNRFFEDRERLQARSTELARLQQTFLNIGRDMRFMSRRQVRDGFGDPEPVLMAGHPDSPTGELIRFSALRPDYRIPGSGRITRAAYRIEDGSLYRVSWSVLDRDQDSREVRQLLISGLLRVVVTPLLMVDGVTERRSSWDSERALPDGIEWRIVMRDGREFRRVFEVAHAP